MNEELEKAELEKAKKIGLKGYFSKAAAHHTAKAEAHDGLSEAHTDHAEACGQMAEAHKAMMEHHKAACKVKKADGKEEPAEPEGGGGIEFHKASYLFHKAAHEFHKASAGLHKAKAAHHGKLSKAHANRAECCSKLAGEQAEPIANENKQEEEAAAKAAQAVELQKADKAKTDDLIKSLTERLEKMEKTVEAPAAKLFSVERGTSKVEELQKADGGASGGL